MSGDRSRSAVDRRFLPDVRQDGGVAGTARSRAAQRRSGGTLRAAQTDIMALNPEDPSAAERYARRNQRFHVVIQDMADSALVAERQRLNFNMSDFFIAQTVGFDRLLTVAARDHDDIIDAIEARDADRAEQVTFRHIARVADEIRRAESL
ncbi:MAG: FCD domain-containing protein [Alphaproteobacteria bacterium]